MLLILFAMLYGDLSVKYITLLNSTVCWKILCPKNSYQLINFNKVGFVLKASQTNYRDVSVLSGYHIHMALMSLTL